LVETPVGGRFEVALERFLTGNAFEFREVEFRIDGDAAVCCVIDSSWAASNVTVETANADFAEAQRALDELVSASAPFASAVHGRRRRYELCSFANGSLAWAPGFPKRD
jgi:hypothetical protein